MNYEPTKKEPEELAHVVAQLCPRAPGELLWALRWLYEHREAAVLLCGQGKTEAWGPVLRQPQQEGPPAYLALACYALLLKSENDRRENER